MPRILVTNCSKAGGGAFVLDTETGRVEQIHPRSTRGITNGPDGIYFVENHGDVYRLDPESLQATQVARTGLDGCHDLRWIDDHFYLVACTGNLVQRLDRNLQPVDSLQIVPDEADVCHANCLIRLDGRLLLTIFTLSPGRREEKNTSRAWTSEGKVLALDWERKGFEVLHEPLGQPHSLVWHEERLYCCESATSQVTLLDLSRKSRRGLRRLHGFVRGLAFHDGIAYVGISRRRKHMTVIQKLLWSRRLSCGVIALDSRTWKPLGEWAIPGTEVYDLVILD